MILLTIPLAKSAKSAYHTRELSIKSPLCSKPKHAFKNISNPFLCLLSELTTSVPGLTSGALSMYESKESTE